MATYRYQRAFTPVPDQAVLAFLHPRIDDFFGILKQPPARSGSEAYTTFDTPELPAERIIAHHNRLLGRGFAELSEVERVRF